MPELWEVKGAAKIRLFGPKDALDRVQAPAGVNQGRVAPDELLWLGDPEQASALEAEGKKQLAGAGERGLVVDNSDGWALFSIVGDGRSDALARLSSVRLPDEGFRQGKVAGVPGKIFAREGRIDILCTSDVRWYVRERLLHSGADIGLTEGDPARERSDLEGGCRMSGLFKLKEFWRDHPIAPSYDVVIIGGGAHGLSTAYELAAKHGVKSVAVLDKAYIGAGGSGRNTTILRANYKTPEGIAFYRESLKIYQQLSQELDFNLLLSTHGHLTLGHSERSIAVQRERAEANQLMGVDSHFVEYPEVAKLCPELNMSRDVAYPILGALYHPPGAVIRHDAVVWGYARKADEHGVHIHQGVEVTGIDVVNGRVAGVQTNKGPIRAGIVMSAVAGWTTTITDMVGVETPLTNHPLQAYVTEPVKPILNKIIVSAGLHVYVSQTDRGEFLIGAEIEPYTTYSTRSTWTFVEQASANALELFPFLARQKIHRQWTGYCDMTPDYSPVMGLTGVDGFLLDSGWGTWGFKASPICGVTMAQLIATGKVPELIAPFSLDRFSTDTMVPEKGAAAVSH